MADVEIKEEHGLGPETAVGRIKAFEETLKKYHVKAAWSGQRANLKGVGVSGSIDVTGSDVTVRLKLGMMARAAGVDAQKLGRSIRRRLKAALQA